MPVLGSGSHLTVLFHNLRCQLYFDRCKSVDYLKFTCIAVKEILKSSGNKKKKEMEESKV